MVAPAASRQVITVAPSGVISGLQVKPGKGLDLRQFGKAKIVRASEIVWDEVHQAWKVVIQDAPGFEDIKGCTLTHRSAALIGVTPVGALPAPDGGEVLVTDPVMFGDYDAAVRFEIAYLDAHRLAGRF